MPSVSLTNDQHYLVKRILNEERNRLLLKGRGKLTEIETRRADMLDDVLDKLRRNENKRRRPA